MTINPRMRAKVVHFSFHLQSVEALRSRMTILWEN